MVLKSLGGKVSKKYSPAIRQFSLLLHFFVPQYVWKQFNTVLSHTHILGKWYSRVDINPDFINEFLKSLILKTTHSKIPIYCSLIFDEMAIRQHFEFCGTKCYGRVNFGNNLDSDSLDYTKQCLVLCWYL